MPKATLCININCALRNRCALYTHDPEYSAAQGHILTLYESRHIQGTHLVRCSHFIQKDNQWHRQK